MRSETKIFNEWYFKKYGGIISIGTMTGAVLKSWVRKGFDAGWNHRQTEVDELQKRVDAAKQLIEDLNKCYQQDHQNKFEYWRGFADSAGILGKRLEQALKGGSDE